jgi:hypothetical protein
VHCAIQTAIVAEGIVSILDSTAEEPNSKLTRWIVTGTIFALLMWLGLWWMFRFHSERKTAEQFLQAVIAEDMQRAYQIWKPSASYTMKDFVEDWGPEGYYGPVKSYQIETAQKSGNASGVTIVVELSPFSPFPEKSDKVKNYRNKEVRLWVESKDLSMGFAP